MKLTKTALLKKTPELFDTPDNVYRAFQDYYYERENAKIPENLVLLYAGMEESKKGPCIEWQTQMMYNAATKTMMPAKFCVQRGEWEE